MNIKTFCRCNFLLPGRAKDLSAPPVTALLPLTHFPSPPLLPQTPYYSPVSFYLPLPTLSRLYVRNCACWAAPKWYRTWWWRQCMCTDGTSPPARDVTQRDSKLWCYEVFYVTLNTDTIQSNPMCTVKHNHWYLLKCGYVFRPVNPTITIFQYKAQYSAVCGHTVGPHRLYSSSENVKLRKCV